MDLVPRANRVPAGFRIFNRFDGVIISGDEGHVFLLKDGGHAELQLERWLRSTYFSHCKNLEIYSMKCPLVQLIQVDVHRRVSDKDL